MAHGAFRFDGTLARKHRAHAIGSGADLIVFSHGLGTDHSSWARLLESLPDRYTALLFDLPGAGPLLPDDFDPDDYRTLAPFADDVLALLEEVGVIRCTFVGHSVSGMIGVLAAIEDPGRFERLVLLNSSPRYLNDEGYRGGFDAQDLADLFDAMGSNYQAWVTGFAPLAIDAQVPAAVESFSAGLLAMRPDVTIAVSRTIFGSDVRALLPALAVPTLLVHSRSDIAVPEDVAHYLHHMIAQSRLVWIDASGHLPHLSAPHEVARALWTSLA
ncbi:alpha/beta hydrolase [soil metagenome]